MSRLWTTDEIEMLCENSNYYLNNIDIAVEEFRRSKVGIRIKLNRLGLTSTIYKSNQAILNELRGYIDGLMLSDGSIVNGGISHAYAYSHGCKYKSWLDKISDDLSKYNVESNVSNGKLVYGFKKGGSIRYLLWTRRYTEFKVMYNRWYKKWYDIDNYSEILWHEDEKSIGDFYIWKKTIPKDIFLTPVCVANWYLGDGNIKVKDGYTLTIATMGFLREDISYLQELLLDVLDIEFNIEKRGILGIYNYHDISVFLNYIKNYRVNCYDYKFPERLLSKL